MGFGEMRVSMENSPLKWDGLCLMPRARARVCVWVCAQTPRVDASINTPTAKPSA